LCSVFYTTNLKLHRGLKIIGNEVPEYLQMIEKHGYLCIRILDTNPVTIQNPMRKTASSMLFFCLCGYFAI